MCQCKQTQLTLVTLKIIIATVFIQQFRTADGFYPVTLRTSFSIEIAFTNCIKTVIIHIIVVAVALFFPSLPFGVPLKSVPEPSCFLLPVVFGLFTSRTWLISPKDVFRVAAEFVVDDATDAWSVAGMLKDVSDSLHLPLLLLMQWNCVRPQQDRMWRMCIIRMNAAS